MKKLKKLPIFKTEDEERDFWSTHSSVDYFDWNKAKIVHFSNLKPSTETISIRFPRWLLDDIKQEANKKDVPYQSLIKVYLADRMSDVRGRYKAK